MEAQSNMAHVSMEMAALFVVFCEEARDRTHSSRGQAQRKGWRSRLSGLLSLAPLTRRSSLHGVCKRKRDSLLGQAVYITMRTT
jgi:hypothetical protein